jgi:ornithine carbamoyltransferase
MVPRHFLTLKDLSKEELKKILSRAAQLKKSIEKIFYISLS